MSGSISLFPLYPSLSSGSRSTDSGLLQAKTHHPLTTGPRGLQPLGAVRAPASQGHCGQCFSHLGLHNPGSLLSRVLVPSTWDSDSVGLGRARFQRFNKVLRRSGGVRTLVEILLWPLIDQRPHGLSRYWPNPCHFNCLPMNTSFAGPSDALFLPSAVSCVNMDVMQVL